MITSAPIQTTEAITYPRDLVPELMRRFVPKPAEPGVLVAQTPIPHESEIEEMLNVAWAATTIDEEGRASTFTLIYAAPSNIPDHTAERRAAYEKLVFEEPRPFEPKKIAKLAPAAETRETLIGVATGKSGKLEIWGLVFVGDTSFGVDHDMAPPYLLITGFRASGFVVTFERRRLVMYAHGLAQWYAFEQGTLTRALGEPLHQTGLALGVGSGAAIADQFARLGERMSLAGHGGTLLVFADDDDPKREAAGVKIPKTSRFQAPDTTLRDAFVRHERVASGEEQVNPYERPRVERRHRDALDHVTRLASVDGAVVMRPDLSVIGFGATIATADAIRVDMVREDPRDMTHTRVPTTLGALSGHRHKSAAFFCDNQFTGAQKVIAFAIVASQDGKLSLFGLEAIRIVEISPFLLQKGAR